MDTEAQKKLKILWLCYFTNRDVQELLKPRKRLNEFAPWITELIKLFENDDDIELHVVSPHEYIKGCRHFVLRGVYYYFVNKGNPFTGRHWPSFFRFDYYTNFLFLRNKINKILKKVQPDMIHLHGAENDFSSVILNFYCTYPVFITIQGFIGKSSYTSWLVSQKKKNELKILRSLSYFGYRTKTMGEDIKAINKNARLYWHNYVMREVHPRPSEKKYDLVFFAKICKEKGVGDLIQALFIIKKELSHVSLCVIGDGNSDIFQKKAEELGLQENIHWTGFLKTKEEVHDLVSTAKISVLPTYNDIISGTILESLFLKIPVVAYDVGSIHEVNEDEEIITLVKKKDIQALAQKILFLLKNPEICKEKAEKGYKRAHKMFFHSKYEVKESLVNIYRQVTTDFKKGEMDKCR